MRNRPGARAGNSLSFLLITVGMLGFMTVNLGLMSKATQQNLQRDFRQAQLSEHLAEEGVKLAKQRIWDLAVNQCKPATDIKTGKDGILGSGPYPVILPGTDDDALGEYTLEVKPVSSSTQTWDNNQFVIVASSGNAVRQELFTLHPSQPKKREVFREAIQRLFLIYNQNKGAIQAVQGNNFKSFFLAGLANMSQKVCANNAREEGCWPATHNWNTGPSDVQEYIHPAVILSNGALVGGMDSVTQDSNGVAIDWNGAAGPNKIGEDQIHLYFKTGNGTNCDTELGCFTEDFKVPSSPTYPDRFEQKTLWDWIWKDNDCDT